jgi:hypothetical protein
VSWTYAQLKFTHKTRRFGDSITYTSSRKSIDWEQRELQKVSDWVSFFLKIEVEPVTETSSIMNKPRRPIKLNITDQPHSGRSHSFFVSVANWTALLFTNCVIQVLEQTPPYFSRTNTISGFVLLFLSDWTSWPFNWVIFWFNDWLTNWNWLINPSIYWVPDWLRTTEQPADQLTNWLPYLPTELT